MVRVGRILRDYAEAGAVNSLIALWGFVDEHTFLTKAGHVGVVYQMRGPDAEGLTHAQRQAAGAPVRGRPSPARRALPRLPVRGQADSRAVRRTVVALASSPRTHSGGERTT